MNEIDFLKKAKNLYGKTVKVITDNDKTIIGKFCIYYRAGDNDYDCDSICIEENPYSTIELKITEIKDIEEIEECK